MNRLLALVLMLCGVAVAQDASLYITNDSKGSGFAMLPLTLTVLDGRAELASVTNHKTVKVSIMPGVHGLALKIANKDITVLTAKPGETYFLRVSVDQGLAYAGTRCVLMKPEEAVYWIPEAQQFIKDAAPAAVPTVQTQSPANPPVQGDRSTPAASVTPASTTQETAQEEKARADRNTVVITAPPASSVQSESVAEAARRAKQRQACLKLAADNPSKACK